LHLHFALGLVKLDDQLSRTIVVAEAVRAGLNVVSLRFCPAPPDPLALQLALTEADNRAAWAAG